MKYQMMLKILFLLLSRDKVSARFIADRFELSLRTVYRYIDELSLADVPIYNVRGRNGGYTIADTYKLPAGYLSDGEIDTVTTVLNELNKDLSSSVLETAVLKIKAISKRKTEQSAVSFSNLIIDGSTWGGAPVYGESLKLLQDAIDTRRKLLVTYNNRNGEQTERIIDVYTLILKQGLWYFYGYCNLRKEFRLFKVGRIEKAKLLNETFERRETTDIEKVLSTYSEKEPEDVDIVIDKSVKADVEEWLGVGSVHQNGNKITASFKMPINDYLVGKLLSFGNKVTVASPIKLKNMIISTVKSIEKTYEK
ncbi:MAG: YafY family transcriptional regulator [Clostridia bacterium]|nr:YafY family transcriptional regulator [Clostridia bacterium]